MRFFNTAGPCVAESHYTLPPLARLNLAELESLIAAERYFILHAPRQTGKTGVLLALMKHLNAQGRYRALYVNVEVAQTARNDVARGLGAIVQSLASAARVYWRDEAAHASAIAVLAAPNPDDWLRQVLEAWSLASARPLVLLIDEVDALVGDTLISVLRQVPTRRALAGALRL